MILGPSEESPTHGENMGNRSLGFPITICPHVPAVSSHICQFDGRLLYYTGAGLGSEKKSMGSWATILPKGRMVMHTQLPPFPQLNFSQSKSPPSSRLHSSAEA